MKKRIVSIVLIIIFIIQPILLLPNASKVHAVVPVLDSPNLTANSATAKSTGSLVLKEFVIDKALTYAAKILLRQLTNSIVNWINSGFEGGPAFVTDFGGFLSDVADEEIGRFIEGSALSFLCDPFQTDIRIALALRTPFERRISCTLSDVIDNIDGFIGGDFSQGGWAGWFELTTVPQNNPYGAYLASASELEMRIASAQHIETTKLDWGRGFMSWEECEELPPDFVGPPRCEIITPGAVIENQLERTLNVSLTQFELADELDEIISALINQLLQQALGGARGLRGASESIGGRLPITSQIPDSVSASGLRNVIESGLIGVNEDISRETYYRNIKQSTLNAAIFSESLLSQLSACYAGKIASGLSSSEIATAQQRINAALSTISATITPTKTLLQNDVISSNQNLVTLQTLKDDIASAGSATEVAALVEDLVILRHNGTLNGLNVFEAQQEQSTITAQMSALDATTQSQISQCQSFPPPVNTGGQQF